MKHQNTKVYSISLKDNVFTKKFLGNLEGKNIVKSNKKARLIRCPDTVVRYQLLDEFSEKEISFLESQLSEACELTKKSIEGLKLATIKSLEAMTDVFLRYDNMARNIILKKMSEIYDVLLCKMAFKRKSVCEDRSEKLDYVYISTNPDTQISTIYNKFFEHDKYFDNIFTRPTLLIHEAAHRTGLREEAGSDIFLNAENYRKFVCIMFDIATFEEMFPNGNTGKTLPLKSNIGRTEFPNPDQPRNDKGEWEKSRDSSLKTSKNEDNTYKDKKTKISSLMNLQDGGVKMSETGNWCAANLILQGLEPGTRYTITIDNTYKYLSKEGENAKDRAKYAIDAIADKQGVIDISRIGIVGEYNPNPSSNYYQGGDLEINSMISITKGAVSQNYEHVDKPTGDLESNENQSLRNLYKLGYYGVFHANNSQWLNTPKPKDYCGGGVQGQKTPDGTTIVSKTNIKYDSLKNETKVSGDIINTAKGRY
ncbi:MAG: hypothetical protein IJI37_05280 [Opitutales bacterium]|nr:hypothetical protein [Opitutales bacterium]